MSIGATIALLIIAGLLTAEISITVLVSTLPDHKEAVGMQIMQVVILIAAIAVGIFLH